MHRGLLPVQLNEPCGLVDFLQDNVWSDDGGGASVRVTIICGVGRRGGALDGFDEVTLGHFADAAFRDPCRDRIAGKVGDAELRKGVAAAEESKCEE